MSKVFISRQDGNVSWGFRLQGGLEFNEPLTVTNIVPNSPADGKLDPGDILLEIAGNNVTNMSHRDALELIQRCANALFVTVHKVGFSYPPGGAAPRPAPINPTWKPAPPPQQQQQPSYYQQDFQQQQQQPPYYQQNFQQQQQQQPSHYQQNFQQQQPPSYNQQNFQQQQQPSYNQQNFQQQPPYNQQNFQQQPYYQHDFQQQQYGYGQPPPPMFNAAPPAPAPPPPPPAPPPPPPPPPMLAANAPPAPMFDADMIANAAASLKSRQPVVETHTSFEQTTEVSNIPAVLAKSLGRPGGPKPFTYTPGGLDLSKIRESARVRRHREYISNTEEPNDTQESETNMSRRMIVPPEHMNQHQYVPQNPVQSFNYGRQQQQPTPQKKQIQHDTDVVTQSRSFQMLQGWISDSEKTGPPAVAPSSQSTTTTATTTNKSAVARAVIDDQTGNNRRGSSGSASNLPSRSFRYLQEQYDNGNDDTDAIVTTTTTVEETTVSGDGAGLRRGSDSHMPSRAFKFIQDQYDAKQGPVNRTQGINNRDDLVEIYNKPPPSFREREPEAPRYTGATVPSRSFRFLQQMTQNDQQNDSAPVPGYNKPQQLNNTYDQQNFSLNNNKIDTHPSRSFKYLQEMTAEQPAVTTTTIIRTERQISSTNNQPIVQVHTTSSSHQDAMIDNLSEDIAATDF